MASDKRLGKEELLRFLTDFDHRLQDEGYQRKFSIYLVGGSWITHITSYRFTRDIDFITPHRDFVAFGGTIKEMERQYQHDIDVFPDGAMPGYSYSSFHKHAEVVSTGYRSFTLYRIDKTAIFLLKVLAGRDRDYSDIEMLKQEFGLPPLKDLRARFAELRLDAGKKDELTDRFSAFVATYYQSG